MVKFVIVYLHIAREPYFKMATMGGQVGSSWYVGMWGGEGWAADTTHH